MRLLVLNIQHYPAMSPNVFRWAAIAEHWAGQGHEVHVLCSRHSERPAEERIAGVQVHRAGQATLLDWAYNLARRSKRRSEPGGGSGATGLFRHTLEKIMDLSWRKLYWPDGSCLWYRPARRKAEALHSATPFDAIISVGTPFTVHWVALAVKVRFPTVRWLMDIEDPFCFAEEFPINNFALYRRRNYRAENRAFRLADRIVLTNPAALSRYASIFPREAGKLSVVPPLYALPPPVVNVDLPPRQEGEIRMGYFGTFYHKIRTPARFLALLEEVFLQSPDLRARLQVHFFGALEPEFVEMFRRYTALAPNLVLHGMVTREATAACMQAMDVLLHIGNTTDYHLPSKSADYLCSGKPVVNIAACEHDSFHYFAGNYPRLLHLYINEESALPEHAAVLVAWFERWSAPDPPPLPCTHLLTPAIAGAYWEAIFKQRE